MRVFLTIADTRDRTATKPSLVAPAPRAAASERSAGIGAAGAALRSVSPPSAAITGGDGIMRTGRMFHRDAQTFLVHLFGQGLEDKRYVVETYRSRPDGQIEPVEPEHSRTNGRRKKRRTIASLAAVKKLRPERDQIIVCTGVTLKDSGMQIWGWRSTGIFAARTAR